VLLEAREHRRADVAPHITDALTWAAFGVAPHKLQEFIIGIGWPLSICSDEKPFTENYALVVELLKVQVRRNSIEKVPHRRSVRSIFSASELHQALLDQRQCRALTRERTLETN
jgi:hypothetical protein